jgi:hypothetical protein
LVPAQAGDLPRDYTVFSRSGQFIVRSPYASASTLFQPILTADSALLALAPDSLAVSCERVKTSVLRNLDLGDRWQGKIHVTIRPTLLRNANPGFVATRYADGWQYAVDLPEQIDPRVLVRTLVHALLTEIANRTPGPHAAEIPLWLVEGLTGRALTAVGPEVVTAPTGTVAKYAPGFAQLQSRSRKPITPDQPQRMRAWLLDHPPLTFAELSLPAPDQLRGDAWQTYQYSAQIFLGELENLPGGQRCLVRTLSRLTSSLNWQTAFLASFSTHFGRLLDLEKWWTVTATHFVQGDQPHAWTMETALEKLESLLRVRVTRQDSREAAARPVDVSLQELLTKTPFAGHRAVVIDRIHRLETVAVFAPQGLVPVAQSYRTVLANYFDLRPRAGFNPRSKREIAVNAEILLRQTVERLDELDRQRTRLRSPANAGPTGSR